MHQSQQATSLKTAAYMLRLNPAEKAQLEQKCRVLAARTGRPVTLAEALRSGANHYLDELLGQAPKRPAKVVR